LYADTMVFIARTVSDQIAAAIAAIERVVALDGFRDLALAQAGKVARQHFGPRGVFMGYDFHVGPGGPRLIEINTNAGGGLFNATLARAQQSCCAAMDAYFQPDAALSTLDSRFVAMFREEWQRQRGGAPWVSVAIVDDQPGEQYLAPEFDMFARLFSDHGLQARIVDAASLEWRDGRLWHDELAIDLVYNRLTDFDLTLPAHQALRTAYLANAVVLTPNPRAHALYADKRNLVTLGNAAQLRAWGVAADDLARIEAVVPAACVVSADNAEQLWSERRHWFFKPFAGYAGKATYRGDKLTRRVWAEIVAGQFIAQALVPPPARLVDVDGVATELKFDVRAYSYGGSVQLLAARIYSGQTTNFRTPGGGFAPVTLVG
jgi:hypothetical protein